MDVSHDPRYRSLAAIAMAELGVSGPFMALAIVSQWQCEQPGGAWPPVHNNPGYVTVGAMSSVGVSTAYATSSPGVHFLSQFPTPEAGARAYGQLIARGARYAKARAQARADNGLGYLREITNAHYGTRYTCCKATYGKLTNQGAGGGASGSLPGHETGPPPAGGGSSGTGASASGTAVAPKPVVGVILATFPFQSTASECSQVTILAPGPLGDAQSAIPIPASNIGDPCTQCPTGYVPAIVNPGPLRTEVNPFGLPFNVNPLSGAWVDPSKYPGQANACVKAGMKPGDNIDLGTAGNLAGDAFGGLAGAIFGALEPLVWLIGFLVLVILGLYVVLKGEGD